MRARLILGWLVGAVLVVGCETNQPIQQDQQTLTLQFRATAANVQEMWTWSVYEDSENNGVGNGVPDDSTGDGSADEWLWCNPQSTFIGSEMPWSFSTQVDIIPDGQTQPVTIARETQVNRSFARYDPSAGGAAPDPLNPLLVTTRTGYCRLNQNLLCNPDNLPTGDPPTTICEIEGAGNCVASGICSNDSSVVCDPDAGLDICENAGLGTCNNVQVTRKFVFVPIAKSVSGASEAPLSAPLNIVFVTDPASANLRGDTGGRCPGVDLGPPNVGGYATPWSFVIDVGDTVSIEARRFSAIPPGFAAIGGDAPTNDAATVYVQEPADPISATLLVDGSPVGVTGVTATTPGDAESFIKFFFSSK